MRDTGLERGQAFLDGHAEKLDAQPDKITAAVLRQIAESGANLEDDAVSTALLQNPTQDNVALVFVREHKGRLLFSHAARTWYAWDASRWLRDDSHRVFELIRRICRKQNRGGKASMATANFFSGVETILRSDPAFSRSGREFDQDNYLLNTPGGTYDLRTGIRRDPSPDDHITKITTVSPSREGGDRFKRFLAEVTGDDVELIHFLQVSLGACLSGAVEGHWMLFWTGGGRNGKNTLGDLVMQIMGDYARKIPASTLMSKANESHPTELASLQGIRLATSSEVGEGDHWHESRINEVTGDAVIAARWMRGDFFEFKRTHKHLIYGNHRPQLRSVTPAIRSRLYIVPFHQSFIGREDPTLPDVLRGEAGYVLQWLIDGHSEWLRLGRRLPPCEAIRRETEDYLASQSTVEMWIAERCLLLPNDERSGRQMPKSSSLYADYQQWKKDRGEQPTSQTRWSEVMRKRFESVASDGIRYRGVDLVREGYGGEPCY